ncbi:hypothetical protein [Phormidium pseudopriestleyi]|nr:hypothetical protein [Phormidium pseudopriestleyi]
MTRPQAIPSRRSVRRFLTVNQTGEDLGQRSPSLIEAIAPSK